MTTQKRASTEVRGPRRGVDSYKRSVPGFYVVNRQTNIAVAAFGDREMAEREAERRNAVPPATWGLLTVVEIPL